MNSDKTNKLYVTDLDGTFLNSNSELSDNAKGKLNKLISEGLNFTISTLRSIESIRPIFSGVNLQLPIIELNGAFITEFDTNKKT